ncbi:hypothetical protein Emag_001884 [Eimeria magna]
MCALVVKRIKLVYRGAIDGFVCLCVKLLPDWALLTVSFVIPLLLMGLTLYLRIESSLFLHTCYVVLVTLRFVDALSTASQSLVCLSRGVNSLNIGCRKVFTPKCLMGGLVGCWEPLVAATHIVMLMCIAHNVLSNQPFADNDDKFMDGIVVAFFTVISFSFVAAGVGQICIEERVRKVRHQQILAGITPLQYWLSAYIVDFVLLVIPCSLIYGLLVWTDISPLVGPYQRPAFLLSMILFCLSVCPLGYAISAAVDSPMTFVMVMLLLGWSLPSIQALFTEVSGAEGIYATFLRYIFMFLPHAAVCEVFTNLVLMNSLASGTMKASELVNWLDFQKIGCPLVYLGVTIVSNWIICVVIDSSTNYPMGEPKLKALFLQVLGAFRTCFHVATCRVMGVRQRWLTRNVSAGSSAGAPSTVATPNQVDYQFPLASGSREAIKKCSHVDGLGLHLQEEEARAAEAICRLRQRPRNKIRASAPQQQLQDSCAKIEAAKKSPVNANSFRSSSSSFTKMDQADPVLIVHRLEKTYSASLLQRCSCCCANGFCDSASCSCCKQPRSIKALKGISFCVDKGSCFAYIGVNGSGKSTTFSILGSHMRQSGGSVFLDGWDALTHPEKTRAKLRYCPQTDALLPALTGAEHVLFYGCLLGLSGSQLSKFCEEFFATIGCKQYMHRPVKSYSGGTKRKLSLGLAMLGSVDLLLLDEPTNGVDPESRHLLWRMIENAKSCKTAGKAILLTSHSMEECEVLSDEVGIIYKGKMLCVGTPTEIRATYGHGYQIECVFFTSAISVEPLLPRRFISALLAKFPALHVVRWMAYKVTASVPKNEASLAAIFCEIEAIKAS